MECGPAKFFAEDEILNNGLIVSDSINSVKAFGTQINSVGATSRNQDTLNFINKLDGMLKSDDSNNQKENVTFQGDTHSKTSTDDLPDILRNRLEEVQDILKYIN